MSECFVYVSLGSNMGDSRAYLQKAADALHATHGIQVDALSPVFETEPQGMPNQPWFANQVVRLLCDRRLWSPQSLVLHALSIEATLGRVRQERFGPRCIDVDVLLFGAERCDMSECTVPHPRMTERAFVLVPLQYVLAQETEAALPDLCVAQCLAKLSYTVTGQNIFQPQP